MALGDKIKFSESANGRNIEVAATATPGTLIHTADNNKTDEMWIWATNTNATDTLLTIEFGGTTANDDLIIETIRGQDGAVLMIAGWPLTGGVAVRAFAASASRINISGYVIRKAS